MGWKDGGELDISSLSSNSSAKQRIYFLEKGGVALCIIHSESQVNVNGKLKYFLFILDRRLLGGIRPKEMLVFARNSSATRRTKSILQVDELVSVIPRET